MRLDNIVIKSEADLRKFVRRVLKENDRASLYNQALREKENQNMQAAAAEPVDDTEEQAPAEEVPAAPAPTDDADTLKKGDIKFEDIVDKLNTVRSGKSFKDAEVAALVLFTKFILTMQTLRVFFDLPSMSRFDRNVVTFVRHFHG